MQNPTSLPSLPKRFPKSRKDGRMFKWVKPGITVRYSAFCNWDYSDIENPEAPINHPYIIESITPEGKLIIKDGKGETRIEVFANDVDTMESDICRTCHKRFPVSFMYSPSKFNPRRCYDCIHEERQLEKETSDMTKTKTPEDIITDELIRLGESTDDDTIKNIINMVHFDIEGRDVLGRYCLVVKLINDIPDFLAEKICLQIEEHLSPSLKEKGIGIKVGYHYFIKTEDKPALENPVKEVELPETAPVEVEPQKSIEDLVNILRETADKLRSMGVKVKIRKIKYTEKKEITVFKKVKHTFKI